MAQKTLRKRRIVRSVNVTLKLTCRWVIFFCNDVFAGNSFGFILSSWVVSGPGSTDSRLEILKKNKNPLVPIKITMNIWFQDHLRCSHLTPVHPVEQWLQMRENTSNSAFRKKTIFKRSPKLTKRGRESVWRSWPTRRYLCCGRRKMGSCRPTSKSPCTWPCIEERR